MWEWAGKHTAQFTHANNQTQDSALNISLSHLARDKTIFDEKNYSGKF